METLNTLYDIAAEDYRQMKSMLKDTKHDIKQTIKFIEILKINNVESQEQESKLQILNGYKENLTNDLKVIKSIIRRLDNIKKTYSI